MCQTNIYVDRYPDGKEITFTQTQYCIYSTPSRPCQNHTTLSHQPRTISYSEPSTEYLMTRPHQPYQPYSNQPRTQPQAHYPNTPPRSRSPPRPILRRHSKRHSVTILPRSEMPSGSGPSDLPTLRPTREHRKERIIIVDSPPTPRTPPMRFSRPQVFTAPSSPANPSYTFDQPRHERGRPIIVDERERVPRSAMRNSRERDAYAYARRDDSRVANVGERLPIPIPSPRMSNRTPRRSSLDRGVFQWDSPSSSHTSFDSRARREAEEAEARAKTLEKERAIEEAAARARALERDVNRLTAAEEENEKMRVMEERIRLQDEKIRARPAVPLPKSALKRRESMRDAEYTTQQHQVPRVLVNGLSAGLSGMSLGGMTASELKVAEEAEVRRRLEVREREKRERELLEREKERSRGRAGYGERERESEDEVLKRLRERQMPRRRFSVGPGGRRHRVLYDDGVYRWE